MARICFKGPDITDGLPILVPIQRARKAALVDCQDIAQVTLTPFRIPRIDGRAVVEQGIPVATGRFRAHMMVELVNDGPVTFVVESR